MEEKRQKIASEIDQLFRMLNLAATVTVMNDQASASSNAAKLFAKLEDMHGDIRLTHDQIHAALLVDKQQLELVKNKVPAERERTLEKKTTNRVLVRQTPMLKKHSPPMVDDEPVLKESVVGEKLTVETKPSPADNVLEEKALSKESKLMQDGESQLDEDAESEEKAPIELDQTTSADDDVEDEKPIGQELTLMDNMVDEVVDGEEKETVETSPSPLEDSSVPRLIQLLGSDQSTEQQKERALLHLMCMCVTNSNRVQVYKTRGTPVLTDLKLWAAEALVTLASDSDANCVEITREGAIPPLVTLLRSGTDMHKQEAAYALGNLAANNPASRAKIAREGAIPPMVAFVKAVTDAQSQWAVYALGFLSLSNEENRVLIAQEGAIPPLVELLRTGTQGAIAPLIELLHAGTEMQKQRAAFALGNLACDNDTATNLDEAILPLVELIRTGSDTQKEDAAYTLGNLAANNIDRRVEIGRKGAIPPLVQLLKTGTGDQKQWAAFALRCLAYENDSNRVEIVEEGAIEALTALMEDGTEEQKKQAAHALKHLVSESNAAIDTFIPDRFMSPLMEYLRAGITSQNANMAAALNTLGTVREGVVPLFHRLVKEQASQHA
ncbi:hypothetical protein JG688_00010372 [Phytophthora aleatoria]|uniref:Uncharacterized protein n=1 Tax=Phytophthora aleatoria TaxID=2496075 RepID=A0A8J5M1R1_9STRA|nr:hypothetical protein JG688_00010372 [Phytophthora aleatoria]